MADDAKPLSVKSRVSAEEWQVRADLAALYRLVHSRIGHLCQSLQQNEELASSIGVNVTGLRLLAYPVDGDRFAGQVREGLDRRRHASVPHGADQNLQDHPMGAVERPR